MTTPESDHLAQRVIRTCTERHLTLATAESLTGGLLVGSLTSVPGASQVVRGSVVAYATDVKSSVLGVDPHLLARVGAVDEQVAAQMAAGVARLLGADLGIACTGVAGPTAQDGHEPGVVWLAVSHSDRHVTRLLSLHGSRREVRITTVRCALELVLSEL